MDSAVFAVLKEAVCCITFIYPLEGGGAAVIALQSNND